MPTGRRIPRSPSTPPSRPPPPGDDGQTDPLVRKAAGELVSLWARIQACEACGRPSAERAYGTGHPLAPIMLLKDGPSPEDLESTNAFASEAEALTKAFEALGIPASWLYGTTSATCSQHLLEEIEAVSPRVLVAFGEPAAKAIAALDGRCGLGVPADLPTGKPVPLRSDLVLLVTEALPEGVTNKEAKRRLWRDLRNVPGLLQA
jgi:uracil-DNA glycosylase